MSPASRKIYETNANSEVIQYAYNPAGDLTNLTDGKLQVTIFGVDEFGRTTNKLDQAGVEILRYAYDANSRLLWRWSKGKGTTWFTNDAVGNLIFVNTPSAPTSASRTTP